MIIATDYETYSYMFYLNSRVLIGWIPIHMKKDLEFTPDILIYRKSWGQNSAPFNHYLKKTNYLTVKFPVVDYPVNNIPELYFRTDPLSHHFNTVYTDNPDMQATIYKRVED